MRILLVDVNVRYLNDTRNLYPRVLESIGDVSFFGPGYVSPDTLTKGLLAFALEHGPFDVSIATEHILFAPAQDPKQAKRAYKRNFSRNFCDKDADARNIISNEFWALPTPKAASLLETDYYCLGKKEISLINHADLIIGWNENFLSLKENLKELYVEKFSSNVNDNWINYVSINRKKILPFAHFVGDSEFDYTPLALRHAQWSVPGTPYAARIDARRRLLEAGHTMSNRRPRRIGGILSRLGLRPYSRPLFQAYMKEVFQTEIRRSRYSFTCGSGLQWPIRKFFEIPALGAVLVCRPCNGFEALGFQDGVNALAATTEDLSALTARLEEDPTWAQELARQGQRLVSSKHTVLARSRQLSEALHRLISGTYHGARWADGEIIFEETVADDH